MNTAMTVPSSVPNADKINDLLARQGQLSFQGIYQALLSAGTGTTDPMHGKKIPGTDVDWDRSTEMQSIIWECNSEGGDIPNNLNQLLHDNVGPDNFRNWSPAQWGLIDGVAADPSLKLVTVMNRKTGEISSEIAFEGPANATAPDSGNPDDPSAFVADPTAGRRTTMP